MEIRVISWEQCLEVWQSRLWPQRVSAIESHSAMLLDGSYSMANMTLPSVYLGLWADTELVGVNSGHLCSDGSWRSRGLWVDPVHRGSGWGTELLNETVSRAPKNCILAWSFPRRSSWPSYSRAGFELVSEWAASETSEANAYCVRNLGK